MERLKRRQDFVAAARALYAAEAGLVVQARDRGDARPPRIGFTATRKLGNAVTRNRVKRRLREVVRLALAAALRQGFDYVLIGRAGTAARPFPDLLSDASSALKRLHRAPSRAPDKDRP